MSEHKIGTVQSLYRYPVKSMLGESRETAALYAGGIHGDRAIALVDRKTGKVATAKQPVLWKAMLQLRAERRDDEATVVVFPDGRRLDVTDASAERALSAYLGREVIVTFDRPERIELERANPDQVIAEGTLKSVDFDVMPLGEGAPDGAFVDYAPVHLIATSSLHAAGQLGAAGVAEPQRYRPNIIIDTVEQGIFCENSWIGGVLNIGNKTALKVVLSTPRCAVPTLAHGATPADKTALAFLMKENRQPFLDKGALPSLGVYAEVLSAGEIACGDDIYFIADAST